MQVKFHKENKVVNKIKIGSSRLEGKVARLREGIPVKISGMNMPTFLFEPEL